MEITFTFKDCLTIFNNYYLRVNNGQLISEGLIIEDRYVTMGKTRPTQAYKGIWTKREILKSYPTLRTVCSMQNQVT